MFWTEDEVRDLIVRLQTHGSDFTELEVKSGATGVPQVGPTLSAFGNMPSGGTILVGLDEHHDFAPVGVVDAAAIEAGIASQARSVVPPVQVAFTEAEIDNATVVIATVAGLPSVYRPCRFRGIAYLRQGDGDYPMSEQEIQLILASRERPRYDAHPIDGTSVEDLDSSLTSEFLRATRESSRRLASIPDQEILKRKSVLAPDGERLTLAGLYALGRFPQQFEPSLSITAAVQVGGDDRNRDLAHMDGPIPELLDSAMDWVVRNTITTVRMGSDGHGRDVTEIPRVAIRELVANALVHRDLGPHSRSKRVQLRLVDNQLVISNPGGLWGVSRAQLGQPGGISAVNEFLYDICKLVRSPDGRRVIEGEGGGIRDVQRALRAANMQPTHFVDKGISFTALVPRHSLLPIGDLEWIAAQDPDGKLNDVQRHIAATMHHGDTWTNARVRAEFAPIDSTRARAALQGLVTAGLAIPSGNRGQRTYAAPASLRATGKAKDARIVVHPPLASTEVQDPLPSAEEPGSSLAQTSVTEPAIRVSRNAPSVMAVLEGGAAGAREIGEQAGLTPSQVRYALQSLMDAGLITMKGTWGNRGTVYMAVRGQ